MASKPAHLTAANASRFQDRSVVDLYYLRLLYPPEAFDILTGLVALVHRNELAPPWQDGRTRLIQRYSTIRDYEPFDLIEQLERRYLFQTVGRRETAAVTSQQSVEDYIVSFHSRSSLSRDHMPAADADAFDRELRTLVEPWSMDGLLELRTVGGVVWGRPRD